MTLLVLFDVDGTLLLTHDEVYVEANRDALLEVYEQAPEGVDVPGETATAHTRRALAGIGLADAEIDAGLERWCAVFSERYVTLLGQRDTGSWRGAPDAAEALAQIDHRALLTGNPERVARVRMQRLGLARFFPEGQGAFGCERERRVGLFELARERAGLWPADRTVAVGDTPLDVETAREDGGRCIAVTTGRYTADELVGADAVISGLGELPAALASLR